MFRSLWPIVIDFPWNPMCGSDPYHLHSWKQIIRNVSVLIFPIRMSVEHISHMYALISCYMIHKIRLSKSHSIIVVVLFSGCDYQYRDYTLSSLIPSWFSWLFRFFPESSFVIICQVNEWDTWGGAPILWFTRQQLYYEWFSSDLRNSPDCVKYIAKTQTFLNTRITQTFNQLFCIFVIFIYINSIYSIYIICTV